MRPEVGDKVRLLWYSDDEARRCCVFPLSSSAISGSKKVNYVGTVWTVVMVGENFFDVEGGLSWPISAYEPAAASSFGLGKLISLGPEGWEPYKGFRTYIRRFGNLAVVVRSSQGQAHVDIVREFPDGSVSGNVTWPASITMKTRLLDMVEGGYVEASLNEIERRIDEHIAQLGTRSWSVLRESSPLLSSSSGWPRRHGCFKIY